MIHEITGRGRIIQTLIYLLAISCKLASTYQDFWIWNCDPNTGLCGRFSSLTPSSGGNVTNFPTLELCRLTCGPSGPLWPVPTGETIIGSKLIKFINGAMSFQIQTTKTETTAFLKDTISVLKKQISSSVNCNSESVNSVKVNILVLSGTLDLNWSTDESYTLQINPSKKKFEEISILIDAVTVFGARHGLETLSQLIEMYPESQGNAKCLAMPENVLIRDKPVFPHRGLLLDTARNFLSIAKIKKHIDAMAMSKLNVLHWHVTDSQSFPLKIPNLPEMTKYGAYSIDKVYYPSEVVDLVTYARVRGIRILVEIDSPAHVGNGWQWGPQENLGNLAVCVNEQPWRSFCIQPPCGQLNPINNNVYQVLETLYTDVNDMVPNTGTFHMGGDEVYIPCWNSSPEILDYLDRQGLPRDTETFLNLWGTFHNRALKAYDNAVGNSKSDVILWSSHLTASDVIEKYLTKDRYVIQTWVPSDDTLSDDLLQLGYRVIVSTKDKWYLDHGFWGVTEYHDWRSVYQNRVPEKSLGGEVCMWGEYIDDSAIEGRVWPRAAAAAERLWSNTNLPLEQIEQRFYRHRDRLVGRGIHAEALAPRWCYQNEGMCK